MDFCVTVPQTGIKTSEGAQRKAVQNIEGLSAYLNFPGPQAYCQSPAWKELEVLGATSVAEA